MLHRLVRWVSEPASAQKPLTRWTNLKLMMAFMGLFGLLMGAGLGMLLENVTFLLGAEEPTGADAIASAIVGLVLMVLALVAGRWVWMQERARLGHGTDFAEEVLPPKPPRERWARTATLIYAAISALFLAMAVFMAVGVAIGGLNDDPASVWWVVSCAAVVCALGSWFYAVLAMRYRRRWLLDRATQ